MKALVLDFGGVLTTNIWASFSSFCEAEGLDPDTLRRLFRSDPEALALLRRLETGELDGEEFERPFAALLGIPDHSALTSRMFAALRPDLRMAGAVRAAREAGLKTSLISNSWGSGIYDRGLDPALFDVVVISGEVGMHKPNPDIYLLACERLGVEPGDCVFVDDLRENCEGAEAVGMTALLHRDTTETLQALEKLLALPVSG